MITCKETRVIRTNLVLPNDVNNHNTLFGGKLMNDLDIIASISAMKFCRSSIVTASTDSVDFLHPITMQDAVFFESYVTFTGTSSFEVFVKVTAENLKTGEEKVAATAFLTFVAFDEEGNLIKVPKIVPETEEEKFLYQGGEERAKIRKNRRVKSKELADFLYKK
ncbi:acyl-CoA thioesterase [Gottfriedia luciferensis]|uniref:acyl-CoA thioesterase n=1 Tax=Gottfriedia luciferensis TaxID=178774 RepID=UPI000B43DEAB|nr:acyl-CoA thioesterase [Gottfriedia luciferensis]